MKTARSITTVLLVIVLISVALAATSFTPAEAAGGASGWKFRADAANTGVYDDGGVRPSNVQKWSYTTGGIVYSSPAISNGMVYVGSYDGNVYALNAADGTKVWSYVTGGTASSPAVANGLVYIGGTDGYIYALNAADGTKLWSYWIGYGNAGFSSPAVDNGVVYVGSQDHNVYALNAADGTKLWSYATGDAVYSCPAVANGVVYTGSGDGNVYALNAADGTKLWSYATGGWVYSCPAVANGVVYTGITNGNVYALNAADGTKLWSYAIGRSVTSSPAVANGVVYVANANSNVYALNAADGTKLWSYAIGAGGFSSPAVANGVVYVGSTDHNVYALNAADGTKLWSYATGEAVYSSPAVDNGVVYVGSFDNNVYALGKAANAAPSITAVTVPIDPQRVNDPVSVSAAFTDPDQADTHTATWTWGDGTTSAGTIIESNGAGTVSGSHVYAEAGVYTVSVKVTDNYAASAEVTAQSYVVVYNPDAGFVTGGGWITSPTGAYAKDPALTGKATFGFVSKYQKGANAPTGNTEFQFKVANLNFKSTSYDWLVIAGAKAQYKGTGTINS